MSKYPDAQIPRCLDTQMSRNQDAQKPRCPDTQMPRYPDTQIPRCPDTQMPRCSDTQIPRCPDTQMPRCPVAQMPRNKRENAPSKETFVAVLVSFCYTVICSNVAENRPKTPIAGGGCVILIHCGRWVCVAAKRSKNNEIEYVRKEK